MVCSNPALPDSHLLHMAVLYLAVLAFTWCTFVRLSESGQAAVVYTLVDSATAELQKQAAVSVTSDPENSTGPVTIPLTLSDAQDNSTQYIVRAEPRQEPQPPSIKQEGEGLQGVVEPEISEESNDTLPSAQTSPEPPPQEDIPSFSEWAQKQLAEAEKKKGENVTGGGGGNAPPLKVRHNKNYASPDCGAKVVGANPEAVSAGSVLSSSRDEYLLNTCNARIWFIVELCEAIQPVKIEMANFELFSSSPREFSVWLSDRHPSRDWAPAGRYIAQDERNLQSFNLSAAQFAKYVKVEVHSHYGQEHYCPVSLFRVYGTSEIEVLDTVDEGHHQPAVDDDDDDDDDLVAEGEGEGPKNLFGSARDAVLSIVKKAAEALAKTPQEGRGNASSLSYRRVVLSEPCVTPSHIVVCVNCSDEFYHRMYELLSCRGRMLQQLISTKFVNEAVANSEFCAERGLDLRMGAPYPPRPGSRHRPIDYLKALLPSEALAALCNQLAVVQRKVVLNVSYDDVPLDSEPVADPPVPDEPTPSLPEPAGTCVIDGNTSEGLATRPPYEPPPPSTLSIRPSRTLTQEPAAEHFPDNNPLVNNVTVEHVPLVVTDNANNVSLPVESLPLVVEDSGSLDSLFSELEQAVVPSRRVTPAPQKESVFVRLANRIKALERNMSLSGQYLEELSRRYKRQVEEMTKALAGAAEERRRTDEREGLRLEQLAQLTQQVETLTVAVKSLLEERDSWQHKATVMGQHGVIVVVEVVVFAVVLYICRWLPRVDVSRRRISMAWPRTEPPKRRKSVDEALPSHVPVRKRRPSEEALIIAGNTHQELLIPEARRKVSKGETRRQRRKRKREMALQSLETEVRDREEAPSLLDSNSTESVAAWWEEEVFSPLAPPQVVTTAPRFVQTALAQRQDRVVRSSGELSDKENKTFLPIKKTGPFKKIVKKFF
ncbi:SUN domain-containing ossification factor isoform X3 [Homalodisca vitripennis]|nr:SUN domain-containing ossification factor isoform X3 [Homalodisca vitripennis]XP_046676320.1 SUN domain-containing ossification factor isoform X3 [Homalodisca vitripennis]XP_046676321.1 SUN domain-containing ossification factor isoform X3 [Homalodisca vitripennis]KAG8329675.1 hypothetical protein J6590_081214 [Homalodisca vitripennis]